MRATNRRAPFIHKPLALLSAATVAAGTAAMAAAAAGSSQSELLAIEEVVVTARKRGAESLQEIGGSIQAIGGDDLSAKAATGFSDYMRQVPGLSANNSGTGQTQITIRGAASTRLNHANPNVPSTAGVYFGETAVTASGFNPDAGLVDIARIEVLRGPQGTLFGASSMSGAIRIIPNEPLFDDTTVTGKFSLFSTESGAESYNTDITVNIPVSENLALRASGYSIQNGGYIDNVYSGPANDTTEDYNSEDIFGARVTALWQPSDTLSLKFTSLYQESHAEGRPDEYLRNDPLEGLGLNSRTSNGGNILFPGERVAIADELQVAKFVDETFDDEFSVYSIDIDKDIGNLSLTAISSVMSRDFDNLLDDTYRTRDWINQANFNWWDIDGDGSPAFSPGTGVEGVLNVGADPTDPTQAVAVLRSPFENNTQLDRISQEIRLTSDNDGGFNYIAGLYYEDETRDFQQNILVPGLDAWLDAFCDFCTTPAFGAELADNFFEGRYSFDTTQTAVFGELSFEFGNFELIAGGRYFDYTQDAEVFFGGFIEFSEDRLVDSIDEDGFSPKVELVYKATDEVTVYTSFSEGFRLGSVQQFISGACTGDLQALGVIGPGDGPEAIPTTIDSDTLENAEIGIKSTLFGGSTTLNATYYRIQWDDARSQVFLGCGWILEGNFIDIESSGIELNLASQVTENLRLDLNIGTTDAEVAAVDAAASSVAAVGDRTPMTPELTYSLGLDYFRPALINSELDFFIRADLSYTDDMVSSLGTAAEQANQGLIANLTIPDNTVSNLYIGIGAENWDLTLFARNLSDERVVTGIDIDRRGPAAYSRGRPRNIGISFRFNL